MPRFLIDSNVGKLARWLRLMGYDAVLFSEGDDGKLLKQALAENRIVLTRDGGIMRRRVVVKGMVKAIHFKSELVVTQMRQLLNTLKLDRFNRPFTICLECNTPLVPAELETVRQRVPLFVAQTQTRFSECPACHRVYWKGTHYNAMLKRLDSFKTC